MKPGMKNFVRFFLFILITAVLLLFLNNAFLYRDPTIWSTDHRVQQYRELPSDSLDVLFLGSSNVMSGINPIQLWKETGMQSYAYCSRAQTFAFSYAYLQDALKTQTPRCVVLEAFSVLTEKTTNGLINSSFHMSVNMDSLSIAAKSELITDYVPPSEWISYYFPLLKNHNYYKTQKNIPDRREGIFMGYCFEDSCEPCDAPVYTDSVRQMDPVDRIYLEKILQLCRDHNIDLYIIKTPVCYPDEGHSKLNDVRAFCEENDVPYYDMSLDAEAWGFDYGQDMRDTSHINSTGAEKLTRRLGELLAAEYDFRDSQTHQHAAVWAQEYERMTEFRKDMTATAVDG